MLRILDLSPSGLLTQALVALYCLAATSVITAPHSAADSIGVWGNGFRLTPDHFTGWFSPLFALGFNLAVGLAVYTALSRIRPPAWGGSVAILAVTVLNLTWLQALPYLALVWAVSGLSGALARLSSAISSRLSSGNPS